MPPAVFVTGFPGFLGSALVERLLDRYPATVAVDCLVQPKFYALAAARVEALEAAAPAHAGRIRLCRGDITLPDLGLGSRLAAHQQETLEVYHLAAVYDLGVSRALGMEVNLGGTQHVLQFAEGCPKLSRFQYISTCYVSGRYEGTFEEEDLEKGQAFNNHYEETKYLAEVEVQRHMRAGLPVTIYRPSIVVGDSTTGATQKFDGPYAIMQWILRWPHIAPVPLAGRPEAYEVNVVPRDFVVDAIAYLSGLDASKDKVYQLCNPNPETVGEMLRLIARAADRRLLYIPLPRAVAKAALRYVPALRRWMGVAPEAVDYFVHPTHYTCRSTLQDLRPAGIGCPPFAAYVDQLLAFFRSHPDVSVSAMA